MPTSTDLDYLPKSIGEYEIIRPLARGGMGHVYLARHTKLGREVALKVLAGHRLADPRMQERFEADPEARPQTPAAVAEKLATLTPGSDVKFENVTDNAQAKQAAPAVQKIAEKVDHRYAPLAFGILIDEGEQFSAAIKAARQTLQASDGGDFVRTDAGTWHRIQGDVQAPCTALHDSHLYALVDNDNDDRIRWADLQGHIISAQVGVGSGNIRLQFDDQLAQRMSDVTGKNLNRQLAVIVDHRIVAAPYIRSRLLNAAEISLSLSAEETGFLIQAISGGLVTPVARDNGHASARAAVNAAKQIRDAQNVTRNNMKQIGIAFHNFHDVYKKLPGSSNKLEGAHRDDADKKVHPFSWRVAILPFVEQQPLFEQYRFHEPWDSEANLKLLEQMPAVYRSPFAPADQPAGHTNYQGFATDQGLLGSKDGQSFHDVTDGTSNTVLVIESSAWVPWTKPQDLTEIPDFFAGQPINMLLGDASVLSKDELDEAELQKASPATAAKRSSGEESHGESSK